jgi:CubicO group peptidase (beta-lactamase class C family)
MAGYVERGEIPGMVTLVSRGDELHVDAIGSMTPDGPPMGRDAIFRLASMTKPIVAVAILSLIEECRLRLDDPVDRWLPELANPRVLTSVDASIDDTVPANRAITVRDLLDFRLGYGILLAPDTYPIQVAIRDRQIISPPPLVPPPPDEWIRRLGSLPLLSQPGESWYYNTGSDIQGILIQRVTGQSLGAFLDERIFGPLGMTDTGFVVPKEKLDRLPGLYGPGLEPVLDNDWTAEPTIQSGAAGLVSTVDDYVTFARMLMNFGKHGDERILARPTVELMTTDQLTAQQKVDGIEFLNGRGWGFGVAVATARTGVAVVPGQYGWDGGTGTSWRSTPSEDLITILLTQRTLDGPPPPPAPLDLPTLAFQAIDD